MKKAKKPILLFLLACIVGTLIGISLAGGHHDGPTEQILSFPYGFITLFHTPFFIVPLISIAVFVHQLNVGKWESFTFNTIHFLNCLFLVTLSSLLSLSLYNI